MMKNKETFMKKTKDFAGTFIGVLIWALTMNYAIEWLNSPGTVLTLFFAGLIWFGASCYVNGENKPAEVIILIDRNANSLTKKKNQRRKL